MALLSRVRKKTLVFLISAFLATGVGATTIYALNIQSETEETKTQVYKVETPPKPQEETEIEEEAEAPAVVGFSEAPIVQTSQNPVPEPESTVPVRPNYLHHSLQNNISPDDEEKTWACFAAALDQVSDRNIGFSDINLVAQVSRQLRNPCGHGNDTYVTDGRFITSHVEWCIQRAAGSSVPPIVNSAVASEMCSGF